jgi:predicted permease
MSHFLRDLKYALRQLRHTRGFSSIAILTMALSIGAATAVFCVVDAVIVRPLPYNHPEKIYNPSAQSAQHYGQPFSWPSYEDVRAQTHSFKALAGYTFWDQMNLETPSGPVAENVVKGTDNLFEVCGVRPILGRTFLPGEQQAGRNDIVVLSYEVWKTQFGGQANAIGQAVKLDGRLYTVIGVMPAGFRFPIFLAKAIYIPLHIDQPWMPNRGSHFLQTIARLNDGVTPAQARADLQQAMDNVGRAFPDSDGGRTNEMIRIDLYGASKTRGAMWVLCAATLALLAIGCCNVAGLLLARGVKREREIALRTAVGADRGRLIRQLLTESLVLAFLGAAAGVVFAEILLVLMRDFLIHALMRGADIRMNWLVLAATLTIAVLTSVVAALLPALRLAMASPMEALKSGGGAGSRRGQHRLRAVFVVVQVALSMVLLVVAGLLMRSLVNTRNADLGFDTARILTLDINLTRGAYENRDPLVSFYQPFLERVRHLPGVRAAGVVNMLPIQSYGSNGDVHITGQPPYPADKAMLAENRVVSEGYFDAMGARLTHGRMLSPSLDTPGKSFHAVVNQAFEKKFLPQGLDAVGQHIDDSDTAEEKTAIVGVTTSMRQSFEEPEALAEKDILMDQVPPKNRLDATSSMTLVVRCDGNPKMAIAPLRKALHDADPTVPFAAPKTMEEVVSTALIFERMESWLFGIFSALALLLAMIGLYGLISHEVELTSKDIGIRMALGASRSGVVLLVMRRVAWMLAAGVGLGLLLTAAVQRIIGSVIEFRFSHALGVLSLISLLLLAAGALAALLPAWRAARVDPAQALRAE